MIIIGFDFSINKPASCVYLGKNEYKFYSWPFGLSEKIIDVYRKSEISIGDRKDEKYKGKDSSIKMRWEVQNAQYLSQLIFNDLKSYLFPDTKIVFEGLSYGSGGNMGIQLGGYKYMLMNILSNIVPLSNMDTYAPITIKKTAGCSKKGQTKADMIRAFIETNSNITIRNLLRSNPELFQKKTGTWIDHLDDLVDSFWAIETYRSKNG
jgi:hypothetical protein